MRVFGCFVWGIVQQILLTNTNNIILPLNDEGYTHDERLSILVGKKYVFN